jgi:hypothetical protein
MTQQDIRACMLRVISESSPRRPGQGNLQSVGVLRDTYQRLGAPHDHLLEEAVLTVFHELFRTGYLAWGFNLANPNPPFFHVTEQGVRALSQLSRDPANPQGYLQHLAASATINPVAMSYLKEALLCFTHDLPKAAAVMLGCASESLILDLRDVVVARLNATNRPAAAALTDWRIKTVADALFSVLQQNSAAMPRPLRESLQSYWLAFLQQIRAARNDAGHPTGIDPVTFETVHASLLIFPEVCRWLVSVRDWANSEI